MADLLTLILAAGEGTRMKSDLTKVLHRVAGKPMIKHVLDTVMQGLETEVVCIIGHQGEKVKKSITDEKVNFVYQKEQLGTGHAVMQARKYLKQHQGQVLVLCGDTPLLRKNTLEKMVKKHKEQDAVLTVLTASVENPQGYGRIIRNQQGQIINIKEEKDATPGEKEINEINSGVYCFDCDLLNNMLKKLTSDNAQGEYYLTDVVKYLNKQDYKVIPLMIEDVEEIVGINDRKNLARAEKILRERINDNHLKNGVSLIDPDTTYIDAEVEIGRDTIIYPFTYIEGQTVIGKNTVIGPNCRLVDAKLGDNIEVKSSCNINESQIGNNCTIGPFAYIRPGCEMAAGVKIGDFVELKKTIIDKGTKVPHLSYVGDAEIGKNTNIGAGTIFANYDGQKKHKTIVGDSVFIGSNTTLVSPVSLGDKSKTGAGSVVTKDVAEDTVVLGVPARIYKEKDEQNGSKM